MSCWVYIPLMLAAPYSIARPIDQQIDNFSLGCIIAEMFQLKLLFGITTHLLSVTIYSVWHQYRGNVAGSNQADQIPTVCTLSGCVQWK